MLQEVKTVKIQDGYLKVVLVDPWGVGSTGEYLNGLISGLSEKVNLTVFTNQHFKEKKLYKCKINRVFFPRSEKMRSGYVRKAVRGYEYILAMMKILHYLRKHKNTHVVHFNWMLFYKVDYYFLVRMKKIGIKIVYTAHNVLPHIDGESSENNLKKIYGIVDRIVLHGNSIKEELSDYFPNFINKVYVQKHGANIEVNKTYDESLIPDNIIRAIYNSDKMMLCLGRIFFNKGVDRLIDLWMDMPKQYLLVISGKIEEQYDELYNSMKRAEEKKNIIVIDKFISDDLANYLIEKSDIIGLPYRHASMSGVVFTAADFNKPVWSTDAGAIKEYIVSTERFVCENNMDSMKTSLTQIMTSIDKDELKKFGRLQSMYIKSECNWKAVAGKLVDECYKECLYD